MKKFLFEIGSVLLLCVTAVAFTSCEEGSENGGTSATGTLTAEVPSLGFTSGAYSKEFEVLCEGTVGAVRAEVTYKGSQTGWVTVRVAEEGVTVAVTENTGSERAADIVLSAKGAGDVTVAVSQKAAFVSELIGRYRPKLDEENSSDELKYGEFILDVTWKDPANVPMLDLSFLNPEATEPVEMSMDFVFLMAESLAGGLYYGGLTYFDFKKDGTIGAGYCELLDFLNMEFGPQTDFPNPETLEVLPQDAITYYTRDGKVYFAIDKRYLAALAADSGMDVIGLIDGLLAEYPGLGIESTDAYYAIPLKYELASGVLTLKVDKEMMMPYLPLLTALGELVPEQLPLQMDPNAAPLIVPARAMVESLLDTLFRKTETLEIGIRLTE